MTRSLELLAAALFALAVVHTFSTKFFEHLAHRDPRRARLWHWLAEVELVFGFWALVLLLVLALAGDSAATWRYVASRSYAEPVFVLVVMVVAASRPLLQSLGRVVLWVGQRLPVRAPLAQIWLSLAALPLLGSCITEPAAMTLAALLLGPQVFRPEVPERVKYLALGVLLVNVSIGSTLSTFAAPPVLMVAATWHWDAAFMWSHFGWKVILAVLLNASLATWALRAHVLDSAAAPASSTSAVPARVPAGIVLVHLGVLLAVIVLAHQPLALLVLGLLFYGFTKTCPQHQDRLILREASLVACFLTGLVVLGGQQQWWLQPLVADLSAPVLFWGATVLTAIADNAALTYLGSLIEGLSVQAQYSLVAGAVAGGGLTVIANAPNPAAVALLRGGFAEAAIGAGGLLRGALLPTLVAVGALRWL